MNEQKLIEFVPGGNIPRVETKKRECWKFLDWRLNSENDSRVHGQPSFTGSLLLLTDYSFSAFSFVNRIMFHHRCYSRSSSPLNGSSTWFTFLPTLFFHTLTPLSLSHRLRFHSIVGISPSHFSIHLLPPPVTLRQKKSERRE